MLFPRLRLVGLVAVASLITILVLGWLIGGASAPPASSAADVTLNVTLSAMIEQASAARTAFQAGDVATARANGEALEKSWETIESAAARQSPALEGEADGALDAANAALAANPPPADTPDRLAKLDDALGALKSGLADGDAAPAQPTDDSIAIGQQLERLHAASAAISRGDASTAANEIGAFKLAWPAMESDVATRSDPAYHLVENQLAVATADLAASPPDLSGAGAAITQMSDALQPFVGSEAHYGAFDSAITLLREGLEALLIISTLLALVTRAGRSDLRARVWLGAGAGILASLVLATAMQLLFSEVAAGLDRELLEGATGLGAAAMLLGVSYWLHGQSQLTDWRKFLASSTGQAITSGGSLALPAIAFLAVFREGAETILMYLGMAASISTGNLLLGMGIAMVGLVALGLAIFSFGVRLPMKPFFRVMSLLLYYLAFKFVGTGLHALQVAGTLPATSAPYLPSIEILGFFPTWQTTLAQLALLILAALAVAYLRHEHRTVLGVS